MSVYSNNYEHSFAHVYAHTCTVSAVHQNSMRVYILHTF